METELLEKTEPRDAIMVDRVLNIGDLMLQHGAKLHMLPFMRRQDGKADLKPK